MTEPTQLTAGQLLPLAVAAERRQAAILAGLSTLLPPLPDCPACGQPSTALAVKQDDRIDLAHVHFAFKPCGHRFIAREEDVYEAHTHARQILGSSAPNSKENQA